MQDLSAQMEQQAEYCGRLRRRTKWIFRLAKHYKPHACTICATKVLCRRLQANERILVGIINDEGCPDCDSIWKYLF